MTEEISNISNPESAAQGVGFAGLFEQRYSNAFTTGANVKGYELTDVSFKLAGVEGTPGQLRVAIHATGDDDAGTVAPTTQLPGAMVMGNFAGGRMHTVSFPAQIALQPSTIYAIVFSTPNVPTISLEVHLYNVITTTNAETGATGWSIADGIRSLFRNPATTDIPPWNPLASTPLSFSITARVGALFPPVLTDQTFTIDQVNSLTLPAAISGVGDAMDFTYTLTAADDAALPEGLSFNDATRILSGTPTMLGDTELTYISTDTGTNTATTTFTLTIAPPSSGIDEIVLSEVARAFVSSTVSAVTNRISDVGSASAGVNVGGAQVAGVNIGGVNVGGLSLNNSNMASALQNNAQAFATNSDAMKTLLGNSDFSLPLNAVGDGGGFGSVGIWASGEYSDLSGESDDLDWDGELTGFHLGIDGKIRTSGDKNILIGLAVSSLNGDLDYENDANATTAPGEKGNYEIDMTTVSPYIGWRAGVVDLWASVGFGEGEVELTDDADMKSTSDAEQTSFAIGGSVADMVVNKNYSVKLKGELSASEFEIDESDEDSGSPAIAKATLDATRARISVEASRISDLANGRAFEKSAEIGARFDGGDGETGAGVEIGGKLKYHAANGFTAEGSARVLLGHSGDYQEWGIQGTIRKQVRRDGQGLAFHLTPAYGDVNSSVSQLLAQGLNDDANNTANPDYHMNLTTRLGYGIAYRGMVTPYTEMVLGTTDQYRMGINWKPNQTFNLTLLGEQANQNAIRLQGAINF